MRDYLEIGSAPAGEDCSQVGSEGYADKARKECRALINQLRRIVGPESGTAHLSIKSFPHDYGSYYEVVCHFDDDDSAAVEYAFKCERELPENWDEEAKKELR